jgi:type 1 glutamine amidotransferase
MRVRARATTAQVVIAGDDVYEDLFTASVELQDLLATDGFLTRVRMGTALFAQPVDDDLIVLYRASGRFTDEERDGLAEAVAGGAGLLAIHSTAVFDDDPELLRLFGARYTEHGPQPHESRFRVQPAEGHPETAGLTPFDLTHEHYRLELADGVDVLAWREAPYGREPLVTAHRYGAGRVCFVQFGHDLRVWDEPRVRDIITTAAAWLTTTANRSETED